jgi:hypothetical protein
MTSSLSFQGEISNSDIDRLIACPPDIPITLWTLQQPGAVDCLNRDGYLTVDPSFAFPGKENDRKGGKERAYDWMRGQIRQRKIDGYEDEFPIWAFLSRPESTNRKDDVLLRFEITMKRFLISFYRPWEELLHVMDFLARHDCQWPENWSPFIRPYISVNPSDKNQNEFVDYPNPERQSYWDKDKCMKSWEKMFQLECYNLHGFFWKPSIDDHILLQAMVPILYRSGVQTRSYPVGDDGSDGECG